MAVSGRSRQSGWREQAPPERAWKGRPGRSRSARAAEQDRAARGRHRRYVDVGDGRYALASVELKVLPHTRRIRAYLRWSDKGRSPTRYLGQVNQDSRTKNLAAAWEVAIDKGLVTSPPLPDGSWASSRGARSSMLGNRSKDTRPEIRLRSILHRRGLRYRVAIRPIPSLRRTADIVFTRARVAVFVDGCYWHGCPDHYRPSKRNIEFWKEKIEKNRSRDEETNRKLTQSGWTVIRIWEHEELESAANRVLEAVEDTRR